LQALEPGQLLSLALFEGAFIESWVFVIVAIRGNVVLKLIVTDATVVVEKGEHYIKVRCVNVVFVQGVFNFV
jgi:hypothetical protein